MPKYILKRDLPFAKKGEQISQNAATQIWGIRKEGIWWDIGYTIGDLLMDNWIEEVKEPREFLVALNNCGEPMGVGYADGGIVIPVQYKHNLIPYKTIKVREVIDE